MLVGILIGLLLGLAIALGVAIYLNKVPSPFLAPAKVHEEAAAKTEPFKPLPAPTPRSEDKPRFDFYSILPADEEPAPSRPEKQARVQPAPLKETFYLQAGAFHSPAEADNMKARLALLGIEATVQSNASSERGTLHRVRIGPFARVEEVNRTRDTLKQNGIETTLIKGRESAS